MVLGNKGFTIKYLYNALQTRPVMKPLKKLWVLKIPMKIKTFLWGLMWGITLTKDNLLKGDWEGEGHCVFCARNGSIDHIFFACLVGRMIWSIFSVCIYNTHAQPKKG
jgi:hypothetical protein